jgi:hypothetical protein
MSINGLLAARAKLMADPALTAFFTGRYDKPAKHIIGYRQPANANDFPVMCYVPITARRPDSVGGMSKERVSIIIGLNEKGVTDDVFDGVIQTEIAANLAFECLEMGELGNGAAYLADGRTVTDMGSRHPFYEIELSMLLGAR